MQCSSAGLLERINAFPFRRSLFPGVFRLPASNPAGFFLNYIMSFISISNFRDGSRKTRGGRAPATQCTMAVYINASVKGCGNRYALSISVPEEVMQKLRWLIGDRVEVLFDDKDQLLIMLRRVQRDGFALSSSVGKDAIGRCLRGNVKFALPEKLPFIRGDKFYEKSVTVTNEGLVIQFEKA